MSAQQQEQRSRMIEENIGLVHACAHRFKGKGIEYDDLFQAGCDGITAVTRVLSVESIKYNNLIGRVFKVALHHG